MIDYNQSAEREAMTAKENRVGEIASSVGMLTSRTVRASLCARWCDTISPAQYLSFVRLRYTAVCCLAGHPHVRVVRVVLSRKLVAEGVFGAK